MKDAYAEALPLRNTARELGVLFIVNDRCDLAMAIDADGVHLGQEDLPYTDARKLLGPHKVIGLSTHHAGQVKAASQLQPDYLGFGPIFKPTSKLNHDPVVGIEGLKEIRPLTGIPIFAIGGIGVDQVRPVMQAGANGVAVEHGDGRDLDISQLQELGVELDHLPLVLLESPWRVIEDKLQIAACREGSSCAGDHQHAQLGRRIELRNDRGDGVAHLRSHRIEFLRVVEDEFADRALPFEEDQGHAVFLQISFKNPLI